MAALWGGIHDEGWPAQARPVNLSGFVSVMTTQMGTGQRQDFSEASFALLSREYMILSLRLGYHFTTVEAMCTDEPSKNYIRMQYKGGGASLDRRVQAHPADHGAALEAGLRALEQGRLHRLRARLPGRAA